MKTSLYASAAVLALILASPALAQPTDKDDENRARAGHVSHDNETPRGEKPAQPAPDSTVAPNGTMGGERGTREKPATNSGTMAPSGTMGTTGGKRHKERGTNTMMQPARPGTNTTAAPTGTTAGRGTHVHNPAFDKMRRVTTATRRFHFGVYVRPSGWYYHRWTFGEFLPALFFVRTYWILDWGAFFLDAPPPGTVWVRVGDDAILIDQYTGEVIEVVYGIFY